MLKVLRTIIILVVIAGGAAFWFYRKEKAEESSGVLILYGNVDIRQVDLSFRVGGKIDQVNFEEGDRVGSGDVVARLDPAPFDHELALARAKMAEAEANLAKLQRGVRPQEIKQAAARVEELEAALESIQKDYERQKLLVERGVNSRQEYDDILSRRDQTRAQLDAARQALSLAREGYRKEDIEAARAAVAAARASVSSARTNLDDTVLTAPTTGTLLTRVQEPGAVVVMSQTVATLSLDNPVWVRAYIAEPKLGLIYPGMIAQVYTDSRPERPYRAHIGFISPEAEFTPKSVQTEELRGDLVYRLRIIADDPDNGLRQGMPVTVRISETKGLIREAEAR